MNNTFEATAQEEAKGPEPTAEQSGAETKGNPIGSPAERTPEQEFADTAREIDHTDQDIFSARKSIAETSAKLAALRKEMGTPPGSETSSPVIEFQKEKLARLEQQKRVLRGKNEEWIKKHGRENVPEGVVVDDEEGTGREANLGTSKFEDDQESAEEEKRDREKELELRRQWVEEWKERAAIKFEKLLREDWLTKDALNLELAVQIMKRRLPKVMDKGLEDFVNGKSDEPPLTVWIHWNASSLLDTMLGKPNLVTKLDLYFDDRVERVAEEGDLKNGNEGTAQETTPKEEQPLKGEEAVREEEPPRAQ